MTEDLNIGLEAQAFNDRLISRNTNSFIPDLKNYQDNPYFYKSFWRRKKYSDLYVGVMSQTYVSTFKKFLPPGSTILDFGCGPGYFALDLARSGFNVVAYDIADYCIKSADEYLKTLPSNEITGSVTYSSKFETCASVSYDGILCSGVLHHLPNLTSTLDQLTSLFRSDSDNILMFHEPYHKSWTRNDAFIVSIIRLLLSKSGLWYEDLNVTSSEELTQLVADIHTEYVFERDPHETGGQSPNDLSCDYQEILTELNNRFSTVETWPSRSFIYRVLGGLRSTPSIEDDLADLLELIDRTGIDNNLLKPNYMYGFARTLRNTH